MLVEHAVMTGSGGRSGALWATWLLALAAFALAACGSPGLCLGIGEMGCGGQCVNTHADPMNCGTCGRRCGPAGFEGASCDFGTCRCSGSLSFCEREGICLAPGAYTVARCAGTCGSGLTNCVTACADLANNALHCGQCGHACDANSMCVGGVCVCRQPGTERCGNACVVTQSNPLHCGRCGAVCTGLTSRCLGGQCVCPAAVSGVLNPCGEACVDLQQDPTNCGRCGVECAPEQACSLGTCATSCSAGLTDCDRSCRDTRVDRAHCGACGIVCEAACVNSECRR